jgi:hypothetical protein
MRTIAVMQPYFIPYAGYFRLFAVADIVVMYDCVQFPRRGWVHRNLLPLASGERAWFTLPIAKALREALITDLRFVTDAHERLNSAMRKFPALVKASHEAHPLIARLLEFDSNDLVADYLCAFIRDISSFLGLQREMIRSSSLSIARDLRGQHRILAILRELGGTRYVNPSGGRALYDTETFARQGVDLKFLTPYSSSMDSIMLRLLSESGSALQAEISREAILVD